MSNGSIERLIALLKTEEGEGIAAMLNEFFIDDRKKNALIIRLKEIKAEVATLSQEVILTEAEDLDIIASEIITLKHPSNWYGT